MPKLVFENNELVLIEDDTTVKKKEEPNSMALFFSEDYWKFIVSKPTREQPEQGKLAPYFGLKYCNQRYFPFYTIGFQLSESFPHVTYMGKYPLEKNIIEGTSLARSLSGYSKLKRFWLNMVEQKSYNLLTLFVTSLMNSNVEDNFSSKIRQHYNQCFYYFINAPAIVSLKLPDSGYPSDMGISRLIGKVKFENLWKLTNVPNNTALNYLAPTAYLTNLYFCGLYLRSSQMGTDDAVKPLFCMVFKKEYLQVLRASLISNQPIPSEWLELWVDKSLEDPESTINIKAAYVRQIRNPLKKMGILIVIKDDLCSELFEHAEPKKFSTFSEQLTWVNDLLQRMTIQEKQHLGIS